MGPSQNTSTKNYFLLIVFLFVILFAFFGASIWYFYPQKTTITTKSELRLANESYRIAESLEEQGDYTGAIAVYEKAKEEALSERERGQIHFQIAQAVADSGDDVASIKILKEIAANPLYTNQAKAYSIGYMGRLFYSAHDPKLTAVIFSDEPYKGMIKEEDKGDITLAYRRLFEYSSSFYPTAYAEFRIATWYANEIYKMHVQGTATANNALIEEYKGTVRESLRKAEENLQEPGPRESVEGGLALVLNRKANAIGPLILAGDTSFGEAEPLFQQSLVLAGAGTNQGSFTAYHYAVFLAKLDKKRHGDVVTLLKGIYTSPPSKIAEFSEFLKNEKDRVFPPVYEDIKLLASIDPAFKNFLVTLGWKF